VSDSHRLVFAISAGALGLLVGSFLNVCIFRLPRNCMSIVRPRSRCLVCLRGIAWYDNVPVLSWLILGGKCRGCGTRISIRYPMVELLTGIVFAWAAYEQLYRAEGPLSDRAVVFAVQAYLAGALIACTFIDLDFRILPDEITLSGIVLGLACGTAFPFLYGARLPALEWNLHLRALAAAALGAFVGGGSIFAVGVLGKLLFRKEAMGLGDVKLMAFLGAFLGWRGILLTFLLGCCAGSIYGIGQFFFTRKLRGVYVPFGPFLAFGAMAMIFFSAHVYGWIDAYMSYARRTVARVLRPKQRSLAGVPRRDGSPAPMHGIPAGGIRPSEPAGAPETRSHRVAGGRSSPCPALDSRRRVEGGRQVPLPPRGPDVFGSRDRYRRDELSLLSSPRSGSGRRGRVRLACRETSRRSETDLPIRTIRWWAFGGSGGSE